jgi:hypothetical protein
MGWPLLLLLAPATAEPPKASASAELAEIWISACLDGQLRLSPDRIREVGAGGVEAYWQPERRQRNAHYYKILKPTGAGLIITDSDPPTHQGFKSTCELVSRGKDLKALWPRVASALGGKSVQHIRDMDIYTVDNPAEGYRIEVRSWFLSIGHYTDKKVWEARARSKKPTAQAEDSIFE